MDIPLIYFLYTYLAVIVVVGIFGALSMYQAVRFGLNRGASYILCFIYGGAVLIVVVLTFMSMQGADWSSSFSIGIPGISLPKVTP